VYQKARAEGAIENTLKTGRRQFSVTDSHEPHHPDPHTENRPGISQARLRRIGALLERIADYGAMRHPRTPVWSVLAEMACDIRSCSTGLFRQQGRLVRESGRRHAASSHRKVAA